MLKEQLLEYVSAGFSGIWIRSFEHEDAIDEINTLCNLQIWRLATWDIHEGLKVAGQSLDVGHAAGAGSDPLTALRATKALVANGQYVLLVVRNFHRFLGSVEIVQALDNLITAGRREGIFVIVLSALVQIPVELEKQFIVLEHELPDREQLRAIAISLATEPGEMPDGDERERLFDAAVGLTRFEAEGAFSLSLVRHRALKPKVLWELKTQTLKKSGLLELHRGGESFDELGGLDALKSFCLRALNGGEERSSQIRPRGVLLLGVPGTGKSAFAKSLGRETGRPTLILDVGALMGGLVGQTEERTRQALRIVDAMAPCVLLIDEVEKALAGAKGSGKSDSGVTTRLFGSLLTWLSDHQSDVFVICTSNDVTSLPPEFSRAERFDGVFFLDLPDESQRQTIWRQYIASFDLAADQSIPLDTNWTGAEIKSCCRLAALLCVSLIEAAQNVVPIAVTASESVEQLRTWASGRCLSAEKLGVFRGDEENGALKNRQVRRFPSAN